MLDTVVFMLLLFSVIAIIVMSSLWWTEQMSINNVIIGSLVCVFAIGLSSSFLNAQEFNMPANSD